MANSNPGNERRLVDAPALAFPLEMTAAGPAGADRPRHVRDQIVQVLRTFRGERVFRPDFGAGAEGLVFEPNRDALWQLARRQIQSALADALRGEVEPQSISVDVTSAEDSTVVVVIRYQITTIGASQELRVPLGDSLGE